MEKKNEQEPKYYTSPINNQVLNYRIYYLSINEKILVNLFLLVIGGLSGLVFYGGLFKQNGEPTLATTISNIVVFIVVGLAARKMFLSQVIGVLKKRRNNALKTQFRDLLSSLSASLSGGMNVNDSLVGAYQDMMIQYSEDAYIVKEVNEILLGIKNNISIEESLSNFGWRSGVDDISNFATVFSTCYRTGGNLKEVIRRTSDIIGQKIVISQEIETKITSNKLQLNIMCLIPIFIVLMLKSSSADFAESFASIFGIISVTFSIGMFLLAYKVGHKIMDIGS